MLQFIRIFALFFILFPVLVFADQSIEEIYHKQCATCHGNNGDGHGRAGASLTPSPTDFTNPDNIDRLTRENMVNAILQGIPGTSMVAYARRMDKETAYALADYIRMNFMGLKSAVKSSSVESDGKALYVRHCAVCHGDNGNSAVWAKSGLNPPPRNFTSDEARQELSRERMITSVTHGRPGTAMMSFAGRLSAQEIEAVVNFIRLEFMQIESLDSTPVGMSEKNEEVTVVDAPAREQAPEKSKARMDLPFPNGLIGDVASGEQFYQSNCYICHGKNGDGKGPRAHFNRPAPRNFISINAQQELNRPRLYEAISQGKQGTVMPAWATVLNEQQIADVAEYVFQTFIHPQKKK